MKIVGVDGNEANVRNRVGVNVYAFSLLWSLYKLQGRIGKNYRFVIYLSSPPLDDMPKEISGFWEYRVLKGGGLWVLRKLTPYLLLNKDKITLFFTPSHYTPLLSRVPLVCSIMDLGYLEFSEQFKKKTFWQLKYWSAISIFVSKGIIAISKETANDILRHYPFASGKIEVTYLGYDKDRFYYPFPFNNVRQVKRKYKIGKNYILYLGTLKPSKNIGGIIEAFFIIENEFPDYQLVIAGKKGWLFEEIFARVERLGIRERVVFTDFIDEQDKPALMAGASVFVSPSFWEGFGLIALESMAVGTPVVVSNRGSFPEVVGKAGILVNPEDPSNIADGIRRVLKMDRVRYNMLVKKGIERARFFSWERTALETISFFERILS